MSLTTFLMAKSPPPPIMVLLSYIPTPWAGQYVSWTGITAGGGSPRLSGRSFPYLKIARISRAAAAGSSAAAIAPLLEQRGVGMTTRHWNVGDIGAPDLVGTHNREISQ